MNKLLAGMMNRIYQAPEGDDGESNGGGDAPASAPAGELSSADWEGLNADVEPGADDDEGDGVEAAPAASPAAPTGKKPEADPLQNATTDPADPVDPNLEAPADPDASTPVDSDEPKLTPEQVAEQEKAFKEDFDKWRQAETTRLTEVYGFDEDTAQRLQTEPELVLPEVAARLHMQVMQNTLEAVHRMLPQVIPQLLQQQNTEKTAMDTFYGINPDLKKYHKQVIQAGKMFRKLNPKASPEEAAKKIGSIVRDSLGLAPLTAAATAPAAPAAPARRTAPHRPAMAGSGGGVKQPAVQETGLWAEMSADDDD